MTSYFPCVLCGTLSTTQCSHCPQYYCSSSHYSTHRPNGTCLPWRVDHKEGVGRVLVATRDIQPCELVMEDFALATLERKGSSCCIGCGGKIDRGQKCVCVCGLPKCRPECVGSHVDNGECDAVTILGLPQLRDALGYWRMLKLRESKPQEWNWLMSFMSHIVQRKNQIEFQAQENQTMSTLYSMGLEHIEKDTIGHLIGIMATNSIEVRRGLQAFFPLFSLSSHSCLANMEHWLEESTEGKIKAIMRASTKVQAGDEITIRYTHLSLHRLLLQKHIQSAWYFTCMCPRCVDPTELNTHASSFICLACTGGMLSQVSDSCWSCQNCQNTSTSTKIEKLAREFHKLELSCSDPTHIPQTIKKMEKLGAHNLHHSVIQLKQKYVEEINYESEIICRRVMEYTRDIFRYMKYLSPGVSRLRGRILFSICKAKVKLLDIYKYGDKTDSKLDKTEILRSQLMARKMISGWTK